MPSIALARAQPGTQSTGLKCVTCGLILGRPETPTGFPVVSGTSVAPSQRPEYQDIVAHPCWRKPVAPVDRTINIATVADPTSAIGAWDLYA